MPFVEKARQNPPPRRYGDVRDAARYLGVSISYLNKARLRGDGPPFFRYGARVLYDLDALDADVARRMIDHHEPGN
jgi:hypothetical protein